MTHSFPNNADRREAHITSRWDWLRILRELFFTYNSDHFVHFRFASVHYDVNNIFDNHTAM